MRKLLPLLLVLIGCASPEPAPEPVGFHPRLYVTFECKCPEGGCVGPEDVSLDEEWPPNVCVGK